MVKELHDNAEKQRLAPGVQGDAARLSQNTQALFTPLSGICAAAEPTSLDFGNVTNLYGTDNLGLSDRTLLAQATDRQKHPRETDQNYMPAVSQEKILSVAEKLGEDKTRWRTNSPPRGPKCNLYVDAVMKGSGLPRPWAEAGVPGCELMDSLLAKDPRYELPWQTDYSNLDLSRQTWQYFNQKPGDIFVWNTPQGIIHSAIADGKGSLYYAGARDPKKHGFGHAKVEDYTGTPDRPMSYGPPTSVYRYKSLVY